MLAKLFGGISVVLFLMLMGLGYEYKNIQSELIESQAELQIKENSIKELNGAIANQNAAVEVIKVDVVKKQTVYKDRIQYVEKIVEVEKAQVRDLTGEADCNKSKEILNDLFK